MCAYFKSIIAPPYGKFYKQSSKIWKNKRRKETEKIIWKKIKKSKKGIDFYIEVRYYNQAVANSGEHKKCRSGGIGRRAGFRCLW